MKGHEHFRLIIFYIIRSKLILLMIDLNVQKIPVCIDEKGE